MEKISIIVPVYNGEAFIGKCLDSLIKQEGADNLFQYEIVVVNDGSTDNTSKILCDYQTRFPFIKVLEKDNGGAASARKYGIDNSHSDYLAFCDSDDFVAPYFLKLLYENLHKFSTDVIIGMAFPCDANNSITEKEPTDDNYEILSWNRQEAYIAFMDHTELNGALWLKLMRRSLFADLDWYLDINYGEDIILMWQIIRKIDSIVKFKYPIYHYVNREGSITHQKYNDNRAYSYQTIIERMVKDAKKTGDKEVYDAAINMRFRWAAQELTMIVRSDYFNPVAERYFVNTIRKGFYRYGKNLKKPALKFLTFVNVISPIVGRILIKLLGKSFQ